MCEEDYVRRLLTWAKYPLSQEIKLFRVIVEVFLNNIEILQ